MTQEIRNLMISRNKMCRDLGDLLYNRQGNGLTEDEVKRLLEIVTEERVEKLFNRGWDSGYRLGYYEGYNDGSQ